MSQNPLNLLLRFLQEIIGLVMVGYWGFHNHPGPMGYLLGIGIPLLMATIWGVFAVREDPSRSGKTVVNTPGPIRLLIELAFFTAGTFAFFSTNHPTFGYLFTASVVIHYLLSYDRIKWLMTKN